MKENKDKYWAPLPWRKKRFDEDQTVILDANNHLVCTVMTCEGCDLTVADRIIEAVNSFSKK